MTDYRRMEWQYKANRIAVWSMIFCVFLGASEVAWAIKYHFPLWDDIAMFVTAAVMLVARFIQKHTEVYRWDH